MTEPRNKKNPSGHQNPDVNEEMVANNKKMGKKLILLIVFSFGLAAISIPLYRIVCQAVDPGGSSWQNGEIDSYEGVAVDKSRTIEVRFATNVNRQLPWEFEPPKDRITLHPGEKKLVKFRAKNLDQSNAITGQAVYDINPPMAGQHFKKIECFCFTEQTLEPGEEVEMPLYLWFDPEISKDIKQVTLAYTFFNADTSRKRQQQERSALQR
ncbi:MAG: cytochrome c oxidase assembly protein [Myxococcota bacterium]